MAEDRKDAGADGITRRDFIRSSAGAAATIAASRVVLGGEGRPTGGDINIAMVGVGSQGRIIMTNSCLRIPGVRFKAVCDIWGYSQRYAKNVLEKFGHPVNVYADYREMLDKEKDLDAVFVATPDWMHAPIAIACLRAGKHVYCEKEMSNTLEGCRSMVRAARETGKLLQIGHQRRSNPRYLHAGRLILEKKALGRITHCYGQWNRAQRLHVGWPKKDTMDEATLKRHGYDTMERFRNWRWYRKFSGGPIADLGSHQVDIYNWFLHAKPVSVMASGGVDYYKEHEWYDNVMAVYEYKTSLGTARAFYQVLNTTSYGGFHEVFMGDKGSLQISEDIRVGYFFPEVAAEKKEWVDDAHKVKTMNRAAIQLNVRKTRKGGKRSKKQLAAAAADVSKPAHQPHVENFFNAIRKGTRLTCPAEEAFETAVPILRTNDAVATGQKITLTPRDYEV
jgi:predicted dehydrogenase